MKSIGKIMAAGIGEELLLLRTSLFEAVRALGSEDQALLVQAK